MSDEGQPAGSPAYTMTSREVVDSLLAIANMRDASALRLLRGGDSHGARAETVIADFIRKRIVPRVADGVWMLRAGEP